MPPGETEGYVLLTLKFEREGNKWVGICLELGTSTFARTLKRCVEELRGLVIEHLNVLEEVGERERFFQTWGIEFHRERVAPTEVTIHGNAPAQETRMNTPSHKICLHIDLPSLVIVLQARALAFPNQLRHLCT